MADCKWTPNTFTGNLETVFPATFKGLTSGIRTRTNAKGEEKEYYLGSCEFENAKGEKQIGSCRINKGNWDHGMKEGEIYRCVAEKANDGKIYLGLSHLTPTMAVSDDDLGFTGEVAEVADKITVKGNN